MKTLLTTAVCAVGLAGGAHAATATFDFVALAAGNEGGIEGNSYSNNGLGVNITSSHNAYLDDLSGGKPAGLGVCAVLDGAGQCNPSSDDNVTAGESLMLSFSNFVTAVTAITFYDANHNEITAGYGTYTANGSTFGPVSVDFTTTGGVGGTSFFSLAYDASEFYLGSITFDFDENNQVPPVPLPAGLPLLVGALGALGLAARRKKA